MTGNSEIADVLRRAHDEMLVRGRTTRSVMNDAGEVCLEGAIALALGFDVAAGVCSAQAMGRGALYFMARDAMAVRGFTYEWNDFVASDDDVLDAFLTTEKQLREEPS